jgi:hypothetical protein
MRNIGRRGKGWRKRLMGEDKKREEKGNKCVVECHSKASI